jgi:hypothetical protein
MTRDCKTGIRSKEVESAFSFRGEGLMTGPVKSEIDSDWLFGVRTVPFLERLSHAKRLGVENISIKNHCACCGYMTGAQAY